MGNKNSPNGLHPENIDGVELERVVCIAGMTTKDGDTIYKGSDGNPDGLSDGHTGTFPIWGAQHGSIVDKDTQQNKATSEAGDILFLYPQVDTVFIAQIAIGALVQSYTTRATGACFDLAGSYGSEYINQAATTYDDIKVLGPATEPNTGKLSAYGAYQKVRCMYNPVKHYRGPFA